MDFSEGPAACSGAGALRREAEGRGLAQPGEGTDGWIWSPSSSLLQARSHWRGPSHPGWGVQQGHREAVQPPPPQVVKNLTKPTVTCSGLPAEPVLSTGWRGWTPMLLSKLNCLTSQTIEYKKEEEVVGGGKLELIKIYFSKIQCRHANVVALKH